MIYIFLIILFVVISLGYFGYIIMRNTLDNDYRPQRIVKKHRSEEEKKSDEDSPNSLMYPTGKKLVKYQKDKIIAFNNIEKKELFITSFDNLKLAGYLIEGNPNEVVILVHGYRSPMENDFCDRIEIYLKRGSTILLVNDRAHGNSQGRYIGFSELDQYDVMDWVKKVNELYPQASIYLHGVSMGAATVVHTADKKMKNVKGIIDDCGFNCIRDITKFLFQTSYKLPYFPFGYAAEIVSKFIAKVDFTKSDGNEIVKKSLYPIVFIHGDCDKFVPCYMSEKMYDNCNNKKDILIVKGAGHAASYMLEEEKYTELVNKLLDNRLD